MATETTLITPAREERWKVEAAFFDQEAERMDEAALPIDPLALQRYSRSSLRRRFNKEFRFRLMGSLRGKTVLDVGCGDGLNAVMFARMGAHVTGVDVSPRAVELARRRAEINGVSDRLSLMVSPVEAADLPDNGFDLVWGDAVLHHVLDDLELVMQRLTSWAKPDGMLLFAEPVNLMPALRRLRMMVPVRMDATPGERPLVQSEVDLVRRYLRGFRMRHYLLFGRLDRFILDHFNYERTPLVRRTIVNCIDLVDYGLLSLPRVNKLGGACVMYGRPAKDGASRAA